MALWAALIACESVPTKPDNQLKSAPKQLLRYNKLIKIAEPRRSNEALRNAVLASAMKQYTLSEDYLLLTNLGNIDTGNHAAAVKLAAELVLATNQTDKLVAWLEINDSLLLNQQNLANLRLRLDARLALRNDNHLSAAEFGLALSNTPLHNETDAQQLWLALQGLTLSEAKSLNRKQAAGSHASGWTQLAIAYLNNGSTLQQQSQQLALWQRQWPNHPATATASNNIDAIAVRSVQPLATAVAVLPLTGQLSRAGKAIQAAMLAAHLNRPQFERLLFINSANYDNSEDLLSAAQALSAQVIIGPLNKNKAESLANNLTRDVPMVSLNNFDTVSSNPNKAYQMALNIEDEATHLARVAPPEYSRALLISTNNSLAVRAADAFNAAWLEREDSSLIHTELIDSTTFSKNIESGFLLTDAKSRQTKLENIFVEKMKTKPRRRTDFDLILLSATAQEARAINPLLAYHYAGDIPVFSPSIVFDGQQRSVANHDLNGILFADTPWSISSDTLKPQLAAHVRNGGSPSKNLHALGVDAYYLAARTGLSTTSSTQSFNGATGELVITANGEITRRPSLAFMTKQGAIPYTFKQTQ